MNQNLSMRQINIWRNQLQQIIQKEKSVDELVPKNQKEELRQLAQKIGASTRGTGYYEGGKPFGYDASIAELIDNINQALQTATSIASCGYTRRSVYVTVTAVVVSFLAIILSMCFFRISTLISKDANKIAFDALQKSYISWLSVTSVEPVLIDSNNFKVVFKCKNFSEAPALNLNIKYGLGDIPLGTQEYLYESDAIMPNAEGEFIIKGLHKGGNAKQLIDELNNGELSLSFDIHYEDVFGRDVEILQVIKRIMGKFHNISYKVIKGLDE